MLKYNPSGFILQFSENMQSIQNQWVWTDIPPCWKEFHQGFPLILIITLLIIEKFTINRTTYYNPTYVVMLC